MSVLTGPLQRFQIFQVLGSVCSPLFVEMVMAQVAGVCTAMQTGTEVHAGAATAPSSADKASEEPDFGKYHETWWEGEELQLAEEIGDDQSEHLAR